MKTVARRARFPVTVWTTARFHARAEAVWDGLLLYEQIPHRPPLPLRLLLPTPVCTEGRIADVGDESRCQYTTGHLVKRATRIERPRRHRFRVIEQALSIGGGIRVAGGGFDLEEGPDGTTRVDVVTRYSSPRRPRWLWRRIEAAACHAFHRFLLAAMRRKIERPPADAYMTWPACPEEPPAFQRSLKKKCPDTGKSPYTGLRLDGKEYTVKSAPTPVPRPRTSEKSRR